MWGATNCRAGPGPRSARRRSAWLSAELSTGNSRSWVLGATSSANPEMAERAADVVRLHAFFDQPVLGRYVAPRHPLRIIEQAVRVGLVAAHRGLHRQDAGRAGQGGIALQCRGRFGAARLIWSRCPVASVCGVVVISVSAGRAWAAAWPGQMCNASEGALAASAFGECRRSKARRAGAPPARPPPGRGRCSPLRPAQPAAAPPDALGVLVGAVAVAIVIAVAVAASALELGQHRAEQLGAGRAAGRPPACAERDLTPRDSTTKTAPSTLLAMSGASARPMTGGRIDDDMVELAERGRGTGTRARRRDSSSAALGGCGPAVSAMDAVVLGFLDASCQLSLPAEKVAEALSLLMPTR